MMLADFVFKAILALLDFFHPHTHSVELLDQIAHRTRDRIGQLGMVELHHVVASVVALDNLARNSDDR